MRDGREIEKLFEEPEKIRVLSPTEGTCPVCAVRHDPKEPHYRGSLYYQMRFQQKNGRLPTWKDAMAHCVPPVQEAAIAKLQGKGIPDKEIFGEEAPGTVPSEARKSEKAGPNKARKAGKVTPGEARKAGKKKRKEGRHGG